MLPLAATSYYTGAALVGMLFPLYLMAACDSSPRSVVGGRAELPPLPIFRSAAWLTNKLLQNASVVPRLVRLLRLERRRPAAAPTFSDTSSMRS